MTIQTLGEARYESPLSAAGFRDVSIPADIQWPGFSVPDDLIVFEKAGPRPRLFFDPANTRCAIVTCGGLCPGLNNVIRSVTRELRFGYRVPSVIGIRGGYALYQEAARRGRPLAVVGIPKTIDNDVTCVSRTFGFGTAVSEAVRVIYSAHAVLRMGRNTPLGQWGWKLFARKGQRNIAVVAIARKLLVQVWHLLRGNPPEAVETDKSLGVKLAKLATMLGKDLRSQMSLPPRLDACVEHLRKHLVQIPATSG